MHYSIYFSKHEHHLLLGLGYSIIKYRKKTLKWAVIALRTQHLECTCHMLISPAMHNSFLTEECSTCILKEDNSVPYSGFLNMKYNSQLFSIACSLSCRDLVLSVQPRTPGRWEAMKLCFKISYPKSSWWLKKTFNLNCLIRIPHHKALGHMDKQLLRLVFGGKFIFRARLCSPH